MKKAWLVILIVSGMLISCAGVKENMEAKALLQGIWVNAETSELSFFAIGDTLYFPDRGIEPNYFCFVDDSLEIHGADVDRYAVYRQGAHIFQFYNLYGELVKLRKSTLHSDSVYFAQMPSRVYNEKNVHKDSTITYKGKEYSYNISIVRNKTMVLKQVYTHDGIQVDNIFPDNTVTLKLKKEGKTIFDDVINKVEYGKAIPASFLNQAVFENFTFSKIDDDGIHFMAEMAIPDAKISYNIGTNIGFDGKQEINSEL